MKKIVIFNLLIALCFLCNVSQSQTYTSTSNGSWLNPMTWSPFGIPILGVNASNVVINSNVTLDTSYIYTTGTLTINSGKTLSEGTKNRIFCLNGVNALLVNNGIFTFNTLAVQEGNVTNNGTMNINTYLYNKGKIQNNKTILGVDSMLNENMFINALNAQLNSIAIQNSKILRNNGTITATDFYNTDSTTNKGTFVLSNFVNEGICQNDNTVSFIYFMNTGYFVNNKDLNGSVDFANTSVFTNNSTAYFSVSRDFANIDSSSHKAVFTNNGTVEVGRNWLNADTIKGNSSGQFNIKDSTANIGFMFGSFDFCDNTPPPTSPYIDYNTGFLSTNVTFCIHTDITDGQPEENEVNIFPNPTNSKFTVTIPENTKQINILNSIGQHVNTINPSGRTSVSFEMKENGIYFVQFVGEQKMAIKKVLVTK